MMKKVYGNDCLSRSRIHEWFKCFQQGREALEDDERSGRPRNVVIEENAEIVREFIRKEPKSSKSQLGKSAASIYRILTENLRYIKACAKFVPHTLKPHEKDLRIQHSRDIIKEAKKNRNFYSPVMEPCDFYVFGKLHFAMKGKRYADVDAIQKVSTAILIAIPKDDLKKSFDNLLDRANRCIQCEGDYFEADQ